MESTALQRSYTPAEELANAITHGLGAVLAIAAMVILAAASTASPRGLVASLVYGASLVLLYLASTLYHALPSRAAKRVFRKLDHAAIYVLIAGTYTPFALVGLKGITGWLLLAVVWSLALIGVALTFAAFKRSRRLSVALYLVMGWLIVTVADELIASLTPSTLLLILAGGIVYTGGVVLYAVKRPYLHAIWHLCVLTASALHFVAVLDTVTI